MEEHRIKWKDSDIIWTKEGLEAQTVKIKPVDKLMVIKEFANIYSFGDIFSVYKN